MAIIPKSVNLLLGRWRNSAYSCDPSSVLWSCNTNGRRVTIPAIIQKQPSQAMYTNLYTMQIYRKPKGSNCLTWTSRKKIAANDTFQNRRFSGTLFWERNKLNSQKQRYIPRELHLTKSNGLVSLVKTSSIYPKP